jgi:hypothetical protein
MEIISSTVMMVTWENYTLRPMCVQGEVKGVAEDEKGKRN